MDHTFQKFLFVQEVCSVYHFNFKTYIILVPGRQKLYIERSK